MLTLTRSAVVIRRLRRGVESLGRRLLRGREGGLACGISCRGCGWTNLVVAIGRAGLLEAIARAGRLGGSGLLVTVSLGTAYIKPCQPLDAAPNEVGRAATYG